MINFLVNGRRLFIFVNGRFFFANWKIMILHNGNGFCFSPEFSKKYGPILSYRKRLKGRLNELAG
jgi:hypothetical protein